MPKAKQTAPSTLLFDVEVDEKWTLTIWSYDPEFLKLYADEGCILDEKDIDYLIEQLERAKSTLRNQRILRSHRAARGVK